MRFWVIKENDQIPKNEWDGAYQVSINRDTASSAFSSIPAIWYHLDQLQLEPIYEDLYIIGLSVFSLDKRVARKQFQDCWTRYIEVSIPVLEYGKWKKTELACNNLLSYLTGDVWNITFRETDAVYSKHENANRKHLDISKCDCVSLFSGGLDSYCGAIKLLEAGKSPCLIGHNEYPKLRYIQEAFVGDFKSCYQKQHPIFIGFTAGARAPISKVQGRLTGSENTSRGRSLLFLCAAVTIAGIMGKDAPVYIPENGFIGLNVALTNSRKGSCSTRTTHPYFLNGLRDILCKVGINNPIENFFEHKTKREIVRLVKDTPAFNMGYQKTISCSHPCVARYNRTGSREYPINCGYCYPCIIRRASLLDLKDISPYSAHVTPSDFLNQFTESDRSSDLNAVVDSVYRYQNCNEKNLKRLIKCTGRLSEDEVSQFLRVYSEGMKDIIEWLKGDPGMDKYIK